MTVRLMVDRASPPTNAELDTLRASGVSVIAGYFGGANNGGRAWKPADFARCKAQGFDIVGVYVGENDCDDCKKPLTLTATQGQIDGLDAIRAAAAFGLNDIPWLLDVEYGTYVGNPTAATYYMQAWSRTVAPVHPDQGWYAPIQAAQITPVVSTILWIANWDGAGNLANFPNASRFRAIGWQFTDHFDGFDLSRIDGQWWRMADPVAQSETFPQTGFTVGGGFYQFFRKYGGVRVFGYPKSNERQENGRTVQDFQRARFELHADNGDAENWNVELGLVADELQAAQGKIAALQASQSGVDLAAIRSAVDALIKLLPSA